MSSIKEIAGEDGIKVTPVVYDYPRKEEYLIPTPIPTPAPAPMPAPSVVATSTPETATTSSVSPVSPGPMFPSGNQVPKLMPKTKPPKPYELWPALSVV